MPEGGHEVALHDYIHKNSTVVGRFNEIYWLFRSIEIIERATGRCPRGWRAPLNIHSNHSAELLAEEGFLFDASLMGEYVPCVLRTNKGDIIELPAHWGVDGWPQFVQFMDLDYMLQIKSAAVGLDVSGWALGEHEPLEDYEYTWVTHAPTYGPDGIPLERRHAQDPPPHEVADADGR